jgi:hypothetical protein
MSKLQNPRPRLTLSHGCEIEAAAIHQQCQLVPVFAELRQTAVDAFPGEEAQVIPPSPRKPLTTTRTTEGLEADRRDNEKDEPCRQHDRAQNLRIDAMRSSNCPHQIDKRRAEKDAHRRPFDSAVFLPAFGVRAQWLVDVQSEQFYCRGFCGCEMVLLGIELKGWQEPRPFSFLP